MSGPAELSMVAGVLADAGLKATLVIGVGWAVARWPRDRSAAQRHAVWGVTLASLPLLLVFAAGRGAELALDAPWLVLGWGVGCLAASLPMANGLFDLWRLRAHATPDREVPGLFHSADVTAPVTWGVFRPVIVMPTEADGWSEVDRRAALAHERAHIVRRDWLVQMIAWAVCVIFWFHPLVWAVRRSLAQEAEHAADDLVLAEGVRPSRYAELLLTLACPIGPRAALGVSSSLVSARVHAVLAARPRSPRRWPVGVLAMGLSAAFVPALGTLPTWSSAPAAQTCSPVSNLGIVP